MEYPKEIQEALGIKSGVICLTDEVIQKLKDVEMEQWELIDSANEINAERINEMHLYNYSHVEGIPTEPRRDVIRFIRSILYGYHRVIFEKYDVDTTEDLPF